VASTNVAGILLGTIAVGALIAILTGLAAIVGLVRIASAGGLPRAPDFAVGDLRARDFAIQQRLRARYMSRSELDRESRRRSAPEREAVDELGPVVHDPLLYEPLLHDPILPPPVAA
jgi:hypothetical protein